MAPQKRTAEEQAESRAEGKLSQGEARLGQRRSEGHSRNPEGRGQVLGQVQGREVWEPVPRTPWGGAWFHKALCIFSSAYSTHDTFLPLPCIMDICKLLPMNGKYLEDRCCD